MSRQYNFIINPKAGSSLDVENVRHLRNHLNDQGFKVKLHLTRSLAHAGELARQAAAENVAALVVAGGDGTVRTVVEATSGMNCPILIIPTGTENLLACEFGIDGSYGSCVQALTAGVHRNLDVGLANGRCFMAIAGVGFDAEVVRRIQRLRSGHIGHTDYMWPICRTFWEHRMEPLRVEADGQLLSDEPALVFVSNISRYAVGLKISPNADCGDGFLDLSIYRCRGRRELLYHAGQTVLNRSIHNPRVTRRRCRQINIDCRVKDIPVQLDGDPGPSLPLHIEVVPSAAHILVPPAQTTNGYRGPVRFYHVRRWLWR